MVGWELAVRAGRGRGLEQQEAATATAGLGVNPAVHEVADEAEHAAVVTGDEAIVALPAVFVGGRLLGGLDRLMAIHISGELVPIRKDAGALWL
ncbi:hypothetical protein ZWY2020_004506 [Hordeum vulgare]|nr:hypothetical protein ZWY2020_004506 [Hordeum vulgare]